LVSLAVRLHELDKLIASLSAQRAMLGLVFDVDTVINEYEASFGELKIEFMMGSVLQTELMTTRILDKVTNIGTC
jgi:hypothetical protein